MVNNHSNENACRITNKITEFEDIANNKADHSGVSEFIDPWLMIKLRNFNHEAKYNGI